MKSFNESWYERNKGVIDCTINPRIPKGLKLYMCHANLGKIILDPSKIDLFELDPNNLSRSKPAVNLLYEVFNRAYKERKKPLPANALDYLLSNQKEIPHEWEDKVIIFSGSLYSGRIAPDIGFGKKFSNLVARSLSKNSRHFLVDAAKEVFKDQPVRRWLSILSTNMDPFTYYDYGFAKYVEGLFDVESYHSRGLGNAYIPVYSDSYESRKRRNDNNHTSSRFQLVNS